MCVCFSGRKRESLTGNATLHLYPHFKPLAEFDGLIDYINTEVSTSKAKKFPLVTFIDTPGLVDGDMNYPFDVNKAILWLGDLVRKKSSFYYLGQMAFLLLSVSNGNCYLESIF